MFPQLSAAKALFSTLNERNIRYCHWKSNQHLDRSWQGRTDFDLLVDRAQEEIFRSILYEHCCKLIISPPGRQYPAIEDFLGYDPPTGDCFHLHVHYQLILGEQFVKNYRLPLEKQFLDSTTLSDGLKIVTPDLEIIVLTIRALLKYRDRDAFKDMLAIRSPGLPANILQEFAYLLERVTLEEVAETLKTKANNLISPDLVLNFLKIIVKPEQPNLVQPTAPRPGYQLYQLRKQLRQELVPFERHTRREARKQYYKALWCQYFPFACKMWGKKKPASGGALIAFVGADGAGKSTTTTTITQWLSWKMDVQVFYMGSGQQNSSFSQIIQFTRRGIGRVQQAFRLILGQNNAISNQLGQLYRLTENYYNLNMAQTRYQRYLESRRQAAQGTIVIYDRYPLVGIHRVMDKALPPMDGPRIAWSGDGQEMGSVTARLARTEQQLYDQIGPPEHLVLLHVTPEISKQRKPDHQLEQIETKIRAIETMDRNGLQIIDIDTTQPQAEVLRQVKQELWNIL